MGVEDEAWTRRRLAGVNKGVFRSQNRSAMLNQLDQKLFVEALFGVLDETFSKVEGIYLDRGTSLLETLNSITAEEASRPTRPSGTTIAAHTAHVDFYLKVIGDYMQGKAASKIDWSQSWLIKTVTAGEWEALNKQLAETHDRLIQLLKSFENWNDDKRIGGALAVIAHTAFHIGAIRQILRSFRPGLHGK